MRGARARWSDWRRRAQRTLRSERQLYRDLMAELDAIYADRKARREAQP